MDVLKEFEIGGIRIELVKGDSRASGMAQWMIHQGNKSTAATGTDVLALMLIIGAEMDRDDE